jgi:hypothetical protein
MVRDASTNAPIQGAAVWTGSYSGTVFTSRRISGTDAAGHYSIDDECTGNDYVYVQAPTFADVIGPVGCAPTRRTIDISLMPVYHP